MTSNGKPVVLVTGPSGYLGAHVFDALLKAGYHVRGTVRSESKAESLIEKYASQSSDISFSIVPDLQAPGALDDAVQDITYLCHVASPYFTTTNDPVKDLIIPAVEGTKNVLNSALKAPHLKRLTVVSSFASVVDLSKNPRPGYVYTEKDWDPVTEEEGARNGVLGYHASKTFAERTAWQIWESAKNEGKISWDLATFAPPMIYGPPIHNVDPAKGVNGLGTSMKTLLNGVRGKVEPYAPKVGVPGLPAWVDVRNVAEAHVKTLALPAGVDERFLLGGGVDYFEDGLGELRRRGEKSLGEEGRKINPADHFSLDTSKAKKVLGIEFITFEKTVTDTWDRMKELTIV